MHGLPHDVRQDLTIDTALEHLIALSKSERSITVKVGCLQTGGPLRFKKSLDLVAEDRASAGLPVHIFSVGNHSSLLLREAEFRSAHLWTADGDDYFVLTLNLATPLTLMHGS
jgi:hypothetical protein